MFQKGGPGGGGGGGGGREIVPSSRTLIGVIGFYVKQIIIGC